MTKRVIACLAAAVLVCLSACSSTNGTASDSTSYPTNTLLQPAPITATPNLPGH